jgi:ribosomal protein S18 acetylase RimI-like enzyme
MKQFIRRNALVALFMFASLLLSGCWFTAHEAAPVVRDYVEDIDHLLVTSFFNNKEDRRLLILEDEGAETYDVEPLLRNRASHDYPQFKGDLSIKIYEHEGRPAGFITYYKKSPNAGRVQYLAIAKDQRGKGFGRTLMKTAMEDLARRGAETIEIWAMVKNPPAQKLYESLGFKAFNRDESFIYYQYQVPSRF